MEILIALVVILVILLVSVTLIGHGLWLALAWFARQVTGSRSHARSQTLSRDAPAPEKCFHCHVVQFTPAKHCPLCGAARPTATQQESLRELEGTLRQLDRLHQAGALDEVNFRVLKAQIDSEREHIIFPQGRPGSAQQPSLFAQTASPRGASRPQPPHGRYAPTHETGAADGAPTQTPPSVAASLPGAPLEQHARDQAGQQFGAWAADSDEPVPVTPVLKSPRRPFAEVLAAFMEQSNIRWGEIVGGILIVGCSTALVISLWAQISSIPVLKFLIFTTVTAALFGVGFYTEHRWKLPTTSRGILTIAVLLVPLNFLAIAAVSGSTAPPGALVISSELIAPALFLYLVYFAGRVITSSWPQLLATGVLTSSVGQLLIRHFGAPDNSPALLFALGAFPVLCYVAAAAWMLRRALADDVIDEGETNEIFVTLGAITFAVSLPFGLLLYRSGPIGMSMMHLAPLVTLAGTPMLSSGALLWRRTNRDLAVARTVGTSLALFGTAVVLSGMFLSWPNPASIVPAALLNFAVLTAIAVFLELPPAHFVAAGCLSIAYVVAFQVIAGNVPWRNLRVTSLLQTTSSVSTGQALIIPFVVFTLVHEWLKGRHRERDALSYFFAAGAVAIVSLLLVSVYGVGITGDPHYVSAIIALYTAGAFWFAWRKNSVTLTWVSVALLFFTFAQVCTSLVAMRFPWQATLLSFAAACTGGALIVWHYGNAEAEGLLIAPLRKCAVGGSALAAIFLLTEIISRGFEPSSLLATRTFGLGAIWLGLLVLSRSSIFFTAFQMTLTLGAVLSTKSFLQRFDWYAYQPHAWLHPWGLQILGSVLGLMCLAWIVIRMVVRKYVDGGPENYSSQATWSTGLRQSLDMPIAFDHLLAGALVVGFALLTAFGVATGISKELTSVARNPLVFDLAGFPHGLIFRGGGWILWAILLAVMFGNLRERRRGEFALGALVMLWTACPLLAGRFESQFATASAGRWSLAIFLLTLSIAYAFRGRLFGSLTLGTLASSRKSIVGLLLFLTLAPLLFLTLSPVVDAINYVPARGPQAGIFRAMGSIALYSFPLIIAAVALGIYAVRERSSGVAFATGLLVNLTVTVVYVISVAAGNGLMNRVVLANSLQLNAMAAACVALVWMATRDWWMPADDSPNSFLPLPLGEDRGEGVSAEPKRDTSVSAVVPLPSPLPKGEGAFLTCQKLIPVALNAFLIVPVALHLIALPYRAGPGTFVAGEFNGWLAVLLTVAVVIAFDKLFRKPLSVASLSLSLLAAGSLGAFGAARFGVAKWAGLHVLVGNFVLIAWLLLLARRLPRFVQSDAHKPVARLWSAIGLTFADDWEWDCVAFATAVGAIVVLAALRGPFVDPLGAWWSIGALVAMSALAASLNWVSCKRVYLYAAGILFNTAVAIWLIKYQSDQISSGTAFLEASIIALSLASVLWLWLELRARRVAPKLSSTTAASFHNFAALLSLLAMGTVVAFRLSGDFYGFHQTLFPLLDWLALASLAVLMLACVWDLRAGYAVAGLYLVGLMKAATLLQHLGLAPRRLGWALMMAGAIHALGAAIIWRARGPIIAWSQRLKIPTRIDPTVTELKWLSAFNSLLVATVIGLAFWVDLRFLEWPLRVAASLAVAAQALTFGLMAQGSRRVNWQRSAVSMFLLGVVFFGWSFLTPGAGGTWLNRAVILMAAMFAIVGLFGAELDKLIEHEPDWTRAFRDCVPAMAIAGILSLVFVLSTEIYYQIEFGAVRINPLPLLVVALTLAGGAAICIVFAISPRHDPLGLSERRRSRYVYVAEIMLALLFMHIRLTMPWLFTGFFERYWPLVVVAIAYTGVVISEMLRRRQVLVLAQPIERTGALLPLLPVLGFWIAQSQVDYSTLLFVVGGLYGLLSILRKSFWFGLVAALAGNAGLWYLLHHTSEYRFWQHPQLWLIPAAVSVLIAAHLNRKDFSESQMTGIRYLALVTIYVSSTADIFINGVAQSPWLPLVLAGLSLAGVFGGMIFRIRAFLLLGSIFLLLAIATMINYAAVNFGWTWLWYVAGIVTGALIIATFAVFEKKRADVLRVVDGLKDWQR
jgi:hypothetical protein